MLKLKLKRDIKKELSQYVTIFLMVFIGVFIYTGIKSYLIGMEKSVDYYYDYNQLQDLTAYGSFDEHDLKRIMEMDEVRDANLVLTLPDLATVSGKKKQKVRLNFLIKNTVSTFNIVDGEEYAYRRKGVWIDSYYAKKNNLKVGDSFNFTYDGYTFNEKVLGLINVPDKVYDVEDETVLFPNHENYGYVYMSKREIHDDFAKQLTMKRYSIYDENEFDAKVPNFVKNEYLSYNKVIVKLFDKDDYKSAKEKIEAREHTNLVQKIEDDISYKTYKSEVDEGKSYIGVFTSLFIFIAILSVITTMSRVIKKQRKEIGILKALGYKNRRITFNYLYSIFKLSLWSSVFGILFGFFVIGYLFLKVEMEYYEVPNYRPGFDISCVYVALITIFLVCFTTYLSTRKILNLNAAESLKNEKPKVNLREIKNTKDGFFENLDFSSKWNLRDILRNKLRTIFALVGLLGCTILLISTFGIQDSIEKYVNVQFSDMNNYKYKLNIDKLGNSLKNEYGDKTSQTIQIEIAVDKKLYANNIFVTDAGNYIRFVDGNNKFIKLKNNGVYITRKLANKYNYKIGDSVKWRIQGDNKFYKTKIIGFNKDPQNQNITMTKKYLESLKMEYKPDSLYTNKKVTDKKINHVISYQSKSELKKSVLLMLTTMKNMISYIIAFAVILAIIIVYNMGVMSYLEKTYQFATLKVLGFKFKQISDIYIKQNMWITIASIIIGLPFGYLITNYMFTNAMGDNYDFSVYISLKSYLLTALITYITAYIISRLLSLKIIKIDMVSCLKANE